MHSLDAQQFHPKETSLIHAIHRHAVKIQFVLRITESPDALVFHRILEMRMALDVVPSVFTIRIVPAVWHVFDNIAETHAQVYAAHMPNVML